MGALRYSINVTVDGCADHRTGIADDELHEYSAEILDRADALLFGRVVYQMMEEAWRLPESGDLPDWMTPSLAEFARAIDAKPKHVVSSTLADPDWNAQLVEGDLVESVRRLKDEYANGLYVGGVTLPLALADAGLIDEYEFIVHPRIAGHGPTPFKGLAAYVDLALVGRREFASGATALRFEPKR
ncbi:MAG: deaminase [Glycomyces artemisiae]|uniref:Deaminase n=1 Tax=Glycomyces artemisiae TaxID=1076443 RepID=A0A850C1F9_9ACTN|nr:deaminase [Glycomyces artemisiae]